MATGSPFRLIFVCWGNICRSPMAERVARARLSEAGLAERVEVTSAATSTEELGEPLDSRAAVTLRRAAYEAEDHVAHQIDGAELRRGDLIIAMEPLHLDRLRRIGGGADLPHVRLLTDFDPQADPGSGVPDPWYGPDQAFDDTLAAIEAAMPGIIDEVRQRLSTSA